MSCRETSHIDLVGFLDDPRADAFAAFRDHYPRCATCAAEVRAWTELRAALEGAREAAAHPAPELLVRYERAALGASERDTLERHLADCPGCRDELRALRGFDLAALRAAAGEAPAGPGLAERLRGWLGALGRLAWNPAFAYLLVGLLLLPVLRRALEPPGGSFAGREVAPIAVRGEPARAPRAQPEAPADESVEMFDQALSREERVAQEAPRPAARPSSEARVPPPPAPVQALPPSEAPRATPTEVVSAARGEAAAGGKQQLRLAPAAPPARAPAPAARARLRAADVLEEKGVGQLEVGALDEGVGSGARAGRADLEAERYAPRTAVAKRSAAPLPLVAVGTTHWDAERALAGGRLLVPPDAAPADDSALEVRIVDPARRRELRAQLSPRVPGSARGVDVPPSWLLPGSYRVELRTPGADAQPPLESFEVQVGPS